MKNNHLLIHVITLLIWIKSLDEGSFISTRYCTKSSYEFQFGKFPTCQERKKICKIVNNILKENHLSNKRITHLNTEENFTSAKFFVNEKY